VSKEQYVNPSHPAGREVLNRSQSPVDEEAEAMMARIRDIDNEMKSIKKN